MDTPENKPETKAESAEAPANTPAPCDGETNAGVSFSTTGMWMSSTADMAHPIKWYDNAGNEIPLPECVTWIGTGDTPPWTEEKIGAELSKRNRGRLAGIKSALKSCYDDLDAMLAKWNEAEGCDEDDDEDDEKGLDTSGADAARAKAAQDGTAQGTPAAEVGEERKTDDGGITLDNLVGDEADEGFHATAQDIAETVGRKLTEIMAEWEAAKAADDDYLSGRAAIRHLLE